MAREICLPRCHTHQVSIENDVALSVTSGVVSVAPNLRSSVVKCQINSAASHLCSLCAEVRAPAHKVTDCDEKFYAKSEPRFSQRSLPVIFLKAKGVGSRVEKRRWRRGKPLNKRSIPKTARI
ncbi:hypothetical protein PoB_002837400 [Plakobranchus ocellatus]|uniref:Uncharacterized protein n=1 Tax=Plakobranchus ocellatus TaxID=259542 RepID=A0AAV4A5L1_9GAST|nr:hypothetical protein PoB_002837400 [Plakobranchus ocellatus]